MKRGRITRDFVTVSREEELEISALVTVSGEVLNLKVKFRGEVDVTHTFDQGELEDLATELVDEVLGSKVADELAMAKASRELGKEIA